MPALSLATLPELFVACPRDLDLGKMQEAFFNDPCSLERAETWLLCLLRRGVDIGRSKFREIWAHDPEPATDSSTRPNPQCTPPSGAVALFCLL